AIEFETDITGNFIELKDYEQLLNKHAKVIVLVDEITEQPITQTIQVEIDATGHIHPMEALSFKPVGRALLTLLDTTTETMPLQINEGRGSVARALTLLSSPRFAHRPAANTTEVIQRVTAMRDEWDVSK
ncbi:MAG: hypothetical protein Q8Q45_13915, partial [Methylococcaceae bacterium]|nr:hypothetical protein [Methylococcaceae bacterium]